MDSVALASVLSSAAVGLGGLIVASREAAATRRHQREMAWNERLQERRALTYVDLLVWLENWRMALVEEFERGDASQLVDPPQNQSLLLWLARLQAFGSTQSRTAMKEFSSKLRHYGDLRWPVSGARGLRYDDPTVRTAFEGVQDAIRAFAKVVQQELNYPQA